MKVWTIAELQKIDKVEIEHYIPHTNEQWEVYDIKLKVNGYVEYELDLPPKIAKKLYKKLHEIFKGDKK